MFRKAARSPVIFVLAFILSLLANKMAAAQTAACDAVGVSDVIKNVPGNFVSIRAAPDKGSDEIGRLLFGARIAVCKSIGDWLSVELDEGKHGWVASRLLRVIQGENQTTALPPLNRSKALTTPESATCDYDPNDTFVGCWVIISPQKSAGRILNIRNNGRWFWDEVEQIASGNTHKTGPGIRRAYMYGIGPHLQFFGDDGVRFYFTGPFFHENCSIMQLDPYTPLGLDMTGAPTQLLMRLRPLEITDDLLAPDLRLERIRSFLPDYGELFNNCRDSNSLRLENILSDPILLVIPELKLFTLATASTRRLPSVAMRIASLRNWVSDLPVKLSVRKNIGVRDFLMPDGKPIGIQLGGAKHDIRTLSYRGFDAAKDFLKTKGTITDKKYPGDWYSMPGGGGFGFRTSKDSGPTIDIDLPDVREIARIHQSGALPSFP